MVPKATAKRPRGRARKLPAGISRKVLKDGTTKYYAWVSTGERGKKETFPLRATLEEAVQDRLAALKAAREIPLDVRPLDQAVENVEKRLVAQRRREATLRWFKEKAAVVKDHFGPATLLQAMDRKAIEGLRADDVDLKATPPRVFVLGKRGNVPVPLSPEAAEVAGRLAARAGSGPLVPGGWEGVMRLFRRWRERLGEKNLTPHACRHGFVTTLVDSGLNVGTVQALARHATPAMTLRYFHAAPDAAEALTRVSIKGKARPRLRKAPARLRKVRRKEPAKLRRVQ